jgi:hypothetical protein
VTFYCADCEADHEGLPDIGADYPDPYLAIPKAERAKRAKITKDTCSLEDEDGEHFFIRAVLSIPIKDSRKGENNQLGIGVWVSQSKTNFLRYVEHGELDDDLEPTFGWL